MGFAGLDFGSTVMFISDSLSKVVVFRLAILDSIWGGFSGHGNWILKRSFGFRNWTFFFGYGFGLL